MDPIDTLAGVRRCERTVEDLEATAESRGWLCVVLDSSDVADKAGFLELSAEAFGLPEWFGMNWDALEESLADLDLGGAPGVLVLWTGWQELAEDAPRDFATALDVLAGAAAGWTRDGASGGVLILGEGELDVPDLVAHEHAHALEDVDELGDVELDDEVDLEGEVSG
jgi:hypothetical protein